MGVFDNHLNSERIDKESDKLIRKNYKISNSGATLIPKDALESSKNEYYYLYNRIHRKNKIKRIPAGVFKEEDSIFKMFLSNLTTEQVEKLYPIYVNIIRDMKLPCLVYNGKRFYQINRDGKRKVAHELFKNKNIE